MIFKNIREIKKSLIENNIKDKITITTNEKENRFYLDIKNKDYFRVFSDLDVLKKCLCEMYKLKIEKEVSK